MARKPQQAKPKLRTTREKPKASVPPVISASINNVMITENTDEIETAREKAKAEPYEPPCPLPDDTPAYVIPNNEKRQVYAEIVKDVVDGAPLEEAAKSRGLSSQIVSRDPLMHSMLSKLLKTFYLPGHIRREVVRARLNQILLSDDDRAALAAAKQISEDPEVGIRASGSQTVNIGIFSPEVSALIESIASDKLCQVEPPERIVDSGSASHGE